MVESGLESKKPLVELLKGGGGIPFYPVPTPFHPGSELSQEKSGVVAQDYQSGLWRSLGLHKGKTLERLTTCLPRIATCRGNGVGVVNYLP